MLTYFRELFEHLRKRPGMFGVKTYAETAAFIDGCNAGTGGTLLQGFREWLEMRYGQPCSLVWPSMILLLMTPPLGGNYRNLEPDAEAVAQDRMFELLDEFLAAKEPRDGLYSIFGEHRIWHDTWTRELRARLAAE